ncbi:MAG: ATP-binding protein [Labilithrix sp.]|nr:ATP-binding protein [Labilithrix sp.]
MQEEQIFEAYGPESGTSYRLSLALASAFPGKAVVAIAETFDLETYARAGGCTATPRATPHAQIEAGWRRNQGLWHSVVSGVFDVRWKEHDLVVAHARWVEGYRPTTSWFVIGGDRAVVDDFTSATCEFCNEPREAVLAFRGGCWQRDGEIYKAIQAASFEDLVLSGDMAREIRDDFASFLAAKAEYAKYQVPWKRGVLFVGPPGNGKTHCLRATIKMLDVPCLYVQSLKSRYETDDANIARVFDRAREVTPCCLVFEDLDALITADNRSLFLNQLDGFANASGMLTLATTNHPERLDPAILDRPSRFDRKYHFALPRAAERGRYITQWRERLDPAMRIEDAQVEALVASTEGFSFAYLKELFLSSMMRWIKTREECAMATVLDSQLQTLREQMKTDASPTPQAAATAEPLFDFP